MSTEHKRETFCVACEVHLTTPYQPLCPGCLADQKAREKR